MSLLAESEHYRVEHEFEVVTLHDLRHGRFVRIGDFYGDPEAAVIDQQERWVVMIGCGLILYYLHEPFLPYIYDKCNHQWVEMFRDPSDIFWITSVKQVAADVLDFVVDSASSQAGHYSLDTKTFTVHFDHILANE